MAPTLENNDRLVVDKLGGTELADPTPGDIVMLRVPGRAVDRCT